MGQSAYRSLSLSLCIYFFILVTVVPATIRSSTSSCRGVLGCSFTFLTIRFTPRWEILRGAQDQGRLIVNWYFFHFLIIAPTFDSSSRWLPIVLWLIPVLYKYTILSRISIDNSFVLLIVQRLDSDSLKDSVNFCLLCRLWVLD